MTAHKAIGSALATAIGIVVLYLLALALPGIEAPTGAEFNDAVLVILATVLPALTAGISTYLISNKRKV